MTEAAAQVSKTLDAPVEKVWDALTDPRTVGRCFMGSKVKTDFHVGSPITFDGEWQGKPYRDKGKILEVDEGRKLSFSHFSGMSGAPDKPENYHVVTFQLEPRSQTTKVTLTQSNLKGGVTDADRRHKADYEKMWTAVLDGLDKAVAH